MLRDICYSKAHSIPWAFASGDRAGASGERVELDYFQWICRDVYHRAETGMEIR